MSPSTFQPNLQSTFLLGLALAGLVQPIRAQCPGPDGLDGPCWNPANLTVPAFQGFEFSGLNLCWTECVPEQGDVKLEFGGFAQTGICGRYQSTLRVKETLAGTTLLSGTVTADYTRTWREFSPQAQGQQPHQVWRLVVKAELDGDLPAGGASCVVPSCLAEHDGAFYYGYVDYARNCVTGIFEHAAVLHHQCDRFIHGENVIGGAFFSNQPGTYHPETSYSLVGPHTTMNPFVPGALSAPSGALIGEGMRNVGTPANPVCVAEEDLAGGALTFVRRKCICCDMTMGDWQAGQPGGGAGGPVKPPQHSICRFEGSGLCFDQQGDPSRFAARAVPEMPWTRLIATSIGAWTTPASYPGPERVWVDEGLLRYRDSCAQVNQVTDEVFYGATTVNGWQVDNFEGQPITRRFIDLANNHQILPGAPVIGPLVGKVGDTNHLIYTNF